MYNLFKEKPEVDCGSPLTRLSVHMDKVVDDTATVTVTIRTANGKEVKQTEELWTNGSITWKGLDLGEVD